MNHTSGKTVLGVYQALFFVNWLPKQDLHLKLDLKMVQLGVVEA
jgi:hypothetical protein